MRFVAVMALLCAAGLAVSSATPAAPNTQAQEQDNFPKSDAPAPKALEQPSETKIGDVVLKPRTVLNGKLSLLLPQEFEEMGEEMRKLKYPYERRPTLVYTNKRGSVNIAINHTTDRVAENELATFHEKMDAAFHNLYPSATWFKSGVITINGREWMTLDLRTPAIDTQVRNIMVGTPVEGRLLLVSFNTTKELEDEWIKPAEAIIQSLRVRDSVN